MHKPALIIIEGVDRTGKTTLQAVLDKATNYFNLVIIRGPVGFLAYNKLYRKGVPEEYYQEMESGIMKIPHLMVYLSASPEVLRQRFVATAEKPLPKGQAIEAHLNEYLNQALLSNLHKITFDTGLWTAEQIVPEIEAELEKLYPIIPKGQ